MRTTKLSFLSDGRVSPRDTREKKEDDDNGMGFQRRFCLCIGHRPVGGESAPQNDEIPFVFVETL